MLSQFLVSELFAFLLIFSRLGAAFMLMPGFGETYVAVRARLLLALLFSAILVPIVQSLPPPPDTTMGLITLISGEVMIGLFMGVMTRMLITAMHMAGGIIAYQSSLASALATDMTQFHGQDTSLGNLLSLTAVVLLFTTDLHHVIITSLSDSYALFLPGQFPMMDDFADHATRTMSESFRMAMQLASPHLVIGLILYFGAGIISRLMPNIQIFFILLPAQLLLSFFILMLVLSAIMLWFLDYFQNALSAFLGS